MSFVLTNPGLNSMMRAFLGKEPAPVLRLILISNEVAASPATTLGDIVQPWVADNYNFVDLVPADWTGSVVASSGLYVCATKQFDLTPLAAELPIWGWGLVNPDTQILVWFNRFTTATVVPIPGGQMRISPTFQSRPCA